MKHFKIIALSMLVFVACKKQTEIKTTLEDTKSEFIISFGSCNNVEMENPLWKEIVKNNPNIWIWGGDNIYADTEDMEIMAQKYAEQKNKLEYQDFIKKIEVIGVYDDHDYGANDAGIEYPKKAASQQLFLDFVDAPMDDVRRTQEGIYYSIDYPINDKTIKVILLDTRYFRTPLTEDTETDKRFKPNNYGNGDMLGVAQWKWLNNELKNSTASFNIIMSSIQFLSGEHGWETWANMPHEVDKFINLLKTTNAKNVIFLSGDRHTAQFSKKEVHNLPYPIIDFTASGMTKPVENFNGEPNQYKLGSVINKKNFGLLTFNLSNNSVVMEIRGENNVVLETITQDYP